MQLVDGLFIEEMPYVPYFKNLMIEEFEGLTIIHFEREDLLFQAVDSILIEPLEPKKNEKQQSCLMTILKTPKPINSIEISESLYIPPKEKSPLKYELINDLFIEENPRPENILQTLDKIELKEKMKTPNLIEEINSVNLLAKEKEPLINQEIDKIIIDPIPKPEIKIQSLDKLILSTKPKPNLLIEEKDSILIAQKEKDILDIISNDGLLIEGKSYPIHELQNIHEISLSQKERAQNEISANNEIYIAPKEKDELIHQYVDNIYIESMPKKENKKEFINEFSIQEITRPENIIEANSSLFIPKKDKIANENQSIDSILIESKEKEENKIQPMHKINLDELTKPENYIEKSEDLYIQKIDRIPNEFQNVDNLIIEGYSHDDTNLMQKIDDFTIVKVFKLSSRIDKMDSFFIPSKTKEKIKPQTVDSIYIIGDSIQYDDNKIQKMDKINILKKPKEPYKIEKNYDFVLLFRKKNVLIVQKIDQLMIEKEPKDKEFIFQEIDKIEIKEIQKKEIDYIEAPNEKIVILGNKKIQENKEVTVDNICLESLQKEKNQIENVEKMDILKSIKKVELKNIIENKDNIFIPHKEKEKLDKNLVESIFIEDKKYPENLAQIVDKFELSNVSIPVQEIETKESLFIPPRKKLPFDMKQNEYFLIKGIDYPENKEQNTNSILLVGKNKEETENKNKIEKINEINLFEINKPENIIEELEGILILPNPKEELKYQQCDDLPIEGIVPEKNEIQKAESIEILKSEKSFIHEIELIESLYIPPKAKPLLKNENIDIILYKEIPKKENQIEPKDKFNILKAPKIKPLKYSIESNTNFLIKSQEKQPKKPLELQLADELIINGLTLPTNEIQKLEELHITNTQKEKVEFKNAITNKILLEGINNLTMNSIEQNINLYIEPKKKTPLEYQRVESVEILHKIKKDQSKENIIEKNFDFYIYRIEKEILEYQIIDRMLIEGINQQENEIQKALNFMIEKTHQFNEVIIPENNTNFFIKSKDQGQDQKPLEKQIVDSLFVEKIKKEKNKIQKKDEFVIRNTPKVKEILKEKGKKEIKNIVESTYNLFIKPKEKKDLELQMPKFQSQKCIKEDKDSFNILKQKQEKPKTPLTTLSINNSELFIKGSTLPCKKSADNKIEKMEDINIAPAVIKEEYISDLNNKKNMEGEKFNLHGKNKKKEKIEFTKDRMDSLYFSGKEKENEDIKEKGKAFINLIEKKEVDFIIKKEIKPISENISKKKEDIKIEDKTFKNLKEKKEFYFTINKETAKPISENVIKEKEENIYEDKTFKNLIPKKENEFIIIKKSKPLIKPQNEIKQEKSLFIPNEELPQDRLNLLFIEKWKKQKSLIQTIVQFQIENQKSEKKVEEKPEKLKQVIKLTPIKLKPINLEGNITPEYFNQLILLRTKYLEQKDKIQPKSEINIYYPNIIKSSEQKPINKLISTKPESFNLEGNISKKHFQDLTTFKINYLKRKDQIQVSESLNLFLPSQPPKINKNIIPIYSDKTNIQLWIKGKQKKPYIIENKGYFIINSTQRPSKNLIVRGSCFGFMAEPKKPGLVSQDFGIIPIPKDNSKQNWNKLNKQQRSQFFNINGNNNKIIWNKMIKRQKCVKFNIPPAKMNKNEMLIPEKINNIIILGNKPFDQEIKNEDYNYNTFDKDKDQKQKGVVKSTISRIYREPQLEDSQEEFDPFSCCKKRETTKYDKIFKERKTASVLMKENNDINSNIISPLKSRPTENIRNREDDEIKFKDKKERKSDLNLIDKKNKNKLKLMNKDNNGPKQHSIFKKKEKKTELLRDFGAYNEQMYN